MLIKINLFMECHSWANHLS